MTKIPPTEFVRRHVAARLSLKRQAILGHIASQADSQGLARTLQWMLAEDAGCSLSTVERLMRWLLDPASGPVLIKAHRRGYIIVGYAVHDPATCGNVECGAEIANSDLNTARKRAQARERARRYRARKAAQNA